MNQLPIEHVRRAGGVLLLVLSLCALATAWSGCAASSAGQTASGAGGASPTSSSHSTSSTSTGTGTSTTAGTGGAGGHVECPGATLCGGACTNVAFDPQNCGKCGAACAAGEVCSGAKCGLLCSGGSSLCGKLCVDEQNDPKNCGGCGAPCKAGEVCSMGQCGSECLGGTTDCGGKCVDTTSDATNCGGCSKPCPAGQTCSMGSCALACTGGSTLCSGACVDTVNDPANCGGCANKCLPGQLCSMSACGLVCLGGSSQCGKLCVDKNTDPSNCGQCSLSCAPGEACVSGKCGFCNLGLLQCNAACVDTTQDPKNCGGCNVVCAPGQVCSQSACAAMCAPGLTACGQQCVDAQKDGQNCGACGKVCAAGSICTAGACSECDSNVTDCDGDGWMVADGDCCDKPGLCGAQPELVNPGAIEVVGNGIDDNCNGLVDLFDTQDTIPCDGNLASNSTNALDYAKAIGICRQTTETPALLKNKTWGLIDQQILRADGSPVQDYSGISIRGAFGMVNPATTQGKAAMVISSGTASDATETMPGPNMGAPAGFNVSYSDNPPSSVDLVNQGSPHSCSDWYATANPPLKGAYGFPNTPGCPITAGNSANDSVMLYLRLRAPTNSKAFSFNSYFMSAEYPEFVCTNFNDQFIALVDTPNGTPKPIPNPIDKNLLTFVEGNQQYPIGINIAHGTSLFAICSAAQLANPACSAMNVGAGSCMLGDGQLTGTGFEASAGSTCDIGGGTFWLTTAGNVIPGDIVELRISIWDVGDSAYDSDALIDGFQWLANATLPGTGN